MENILHDPGLIPIYANVIVVLPADDNTLLLFGYQAPGATDATVVSKVALHPDTAQNLLALMRDRLKIYDGSSEEEEPTLH